VREGLSRRLWLAAIVLAFCVPLFVGLGRTDLENDEAIYSYAVDGILATGDWLNPILSPFTSTRFLEKPPLKFWIVAAPIALRIVPHDEFGLRIWDAIFGSIAFIYVFLYGRRLAGPLCGALAVFVLFVYGPLLFDHGLRGNNMEAPLILSYCGGIYHYFAWASPERQKRRVGHAAAVMLYFYLGFMTKFVAVLFLPLVLAAATLVHRATLRKAFQEWKLWGSLAVVCLGLIVPWFIYQYGNEGAGLFRVMFSEHVYTRFTASLDPHHVHPWNYYYLTIYNQLEHNGTLWLAIAGGLVLIVRAIREPALVTSLVVAWFTLPLALMSMLTSKLPHYAYPFLPPIALAAGFGPAWLLSAGRPYLDRAMAAIHERWIAGRTMRDGVRKALLALAAVSVLVAIATLILGRVSIEIGNVVLFRNGHVARPLVVALALATIAGRGVAAGRLLLPIVLLVAVMPVNEYENSLVDVTRARHTLRDARTCLLRVRGEELAAGRSAPGIYAVGEERWFLHSYFYYLRDVGGWEHSSTVDEGKALQGLFTSGVQRPMLLGDEAYARMKAVNGDVQRVPVIVLRDVMLLVPGPYAPCAPPVPSLPH
jgi:4-amino-4-deoxy-L-arabinose transferase-like glycosyltransferase